MDKLKVELNFCFNTWQAKLCRMSVSRLNLEMYAIETYNDLIAEGVEEAHASAIKNFILSFK